MPSPTDAEAHHLFTRERIIFCAPGT